MTAALDDFLARFTAPTGGLSELRVLWESQLAGHRILCLAEQRDNAPLWAHYADFYSGVVLEFQTREDTDSPWLEARPVHYSQEKPRIYSATGLAEIMMLPEREACRTLLRTATFTKTQDWSYEREWRVASRRREGDEALYSDYQFHPGDLRAAYFGPSIHEADRAEVHALLDSYPKTRRVDVFIGFGREFVFQKSATSR